MLFLLEKNYEVLGYCRTNSLNHRNFKFNPSKFPVGDKGGKLRIGIMMACINKPRGGFWTSSYKQKFKGSHWTDYKKKRFSKPDKKVKKSEDKKSEGNKKKQK